MNVSRDNTRSAGHHVTEKCRLYTLSILCGEEPVIDVDLLSGPLQRPHKACLPILLYSLEVCNLSRMNLQSLDFTVNRFFMKLFNTNNMHIVNTCQLNFAFELVPSVILPKRLIKFESATDGS